MAYTFVFVSLIGYESWRSAPLRCSVFTYMQHASSVPCPTQSHRLVRDAQGRAGGNRPPARQPGVCKAELPAPWGNIDMLVFVYSVHAEPPSTSFQGTKPQSTCLCCFVCRIRHKTSRSREEAGMSV